LGTKLEIENLQMKQELGLMIFSAAANSDSEVAFSFLDFMNEQ
jgi:hypothetical protein